jgi:hypothetical protein
LVDLCDQRIINQVQLARQLLSAALSSKRAHERFGEWGEARDVGEERRTFAAVR